MKSLLIAWTLATSQVMAQGPESIRHDVTLLLQCWASAGEAGDWSAVADTYADETGFVWIEQGEARYTSRAAILKGLQSAEEGKAQVRNKLDNIVVTPVGSEAAAFRADYVLTVSSEAFSFHSEGVFSGVAIRRDNRWRFLQGAFSARPAR